MILVDREEELKALHEAYTACVNGSGQLVIVSGGVACGKTELVHTFIERAAGEGAALLTATGSQAERSWRFGVLGQLIRSAALLRAVEITTEAPAAPAAPASVADSPVSGTWVLDDLCSALLELAEIHPVVITVDDVQCADEPSRHALLYLQRRLRFSRVLLILTEWTLPDSSYHVFRAEVTRLRSTVHLSLAPLSRAGIARLLDTTLGPATSQTLAPRCHALSGGNPLLVKALIDDHRAALRREDAQFVGDEVAVGKEFRHAVIACLRRWEPVMLEVARGLGVLGSAGSTDLLDDLLDLASGSAQQVLEVLEMAGLLEGHRFRHPMIESAVLDSLGSAERAAQHLRAAELLFGHDAKATEIAAQLTTADRFGGAVTGEWAVDVLRHAAQDDLVADQFDVATQQLDLAARSSGDDVQRAEITSLLLRVEWLRRPSAAARHLDPLGAARANGRLSRDDAFNLAKFLLWYGHMDDLADTLGTIATSTSSGQGIAGSLGLAVEWLVFLCPPAAVGLASVTAVPSQAVRDTPWTRAVDMLGRVRSGGSREEIVTAAEHVLRNSRLGEQTIDLQLSALAALVYVDGSERAADLCETLLADAISWRAPAWRAMIGAVYALVLLRRGDLPDAAEHARAAYDQFSPQGWGVGIGIPLSVQVAAATRMGMHDKASALLHLPVPDAMFHTQFGLFYLYERGQHYLATDHVHSALADFQHCGDLMRSWNIELPAMVPWRLGAAEAQVALGNPEAARVLVGEQLKQPGPGARTRGIALRVLAVASVPARRVRLLQESVDLLDTGGDRFESARSLLELSHALHAVGEPEKARTAANRVAQLARHCGSEILSRDLVSRDDSDVTGPGNHVTTPLWMISTLSDAERRVAVLAALGLTNREIGAKLYITMSTVEQHLTRVYRKLKVNRRTDLPADLRQHAAAVLGGFLAGGGSPHQPGVTTSPATASARR